MSTPKVLIVFGAGANTGLATIKKFANGGYKIAAISRRPSPELTAAADFIVSADLKDPMQVDGAFEKVTSELGAPHVVLYNAYDLQIVDPQNPLQVSSQRFAECLAVNTISAYTAAVQAVKHWAHLPNSASKTFLYTGNMTTTQLWPSTHTLGVGKNATLYWLETAAAAYAPKGYKFYFVDERNEAGESVMQAIDGEAHAVEYWRLAEEIREQRPEVNWTFVKGKGGYVQNHIVHPQRELRGMDFNFPGLPEGGADASMLYRLIKENPEAFPASVGAAEK